MADDQEEQMLYWYEARVKSDRWPVLVDQKSFSEAVREGKKKVAVTFVGYTSSWNYVKQGDPPFESWDEGKVSVSLVKKDIADRLNQWFKDPPTVSAKQAYFSSKKVEGMVGKGVWSALKSSIQFLRTHDEILFDKLNLDMITYINDRYKIDLRQIQFRPGQLFFFKPSAANSSIWPVQVPDQVKDTGGAHLDIRYAQDDAGDILKVNKGQLVRELVPNFKRWCCRYIIDDVAADDKHSGFHHVYNENDPLDVLGKDVNACKKAFKATLNYFKMHVKHDYHNNEFIARMQKYDIENFKGKSFRLMSNDTSSQAVNNQSEEKMKRKEGGEATPLASNSPDLVIDPDDTPILSSEPNTPALSRAVDATPILDSQLTSPTSLLKEEIDPDATPILSSEPNNPALSRGGDVTPILDSQPMSPTSLQKEENDLGATPILNLQQTHGVEGTLLNECASGHWLAKNSSEKVSESNTIATKKNGSNLEKKRKLHSRLGVDESQPRAEYVPTKTPYIVPTKKIRLHETTVSSTKDGKQKKLKSCLKRSKSTGGSKRVNWPEDKRQRLTQVRQVEGLNSNMGQNAAAVDSLNVFRRPRLVRRSSVEFALLDTIGKHENNLPQDIFGSNNTTIVVNIET